MAFRFGLKSVLRLRQSLEDRERLRLALVLGAISRIDRQCQQLDLDRSRILSDARDSLQAGISAAELQFEHARASVAARSKAPLLLQKVRLDKERVAQEQALVEAQRKRKILEKMRERQLELYREIERRMEQQQMDDLHSARSTNRV
jgi:flagellar FliJ protein